MKTLIRTTGWAAVPGHGRWRVPAVLMMNPTEVAGVFHPGDGIMISGKGQAPPPGKILATSLKITIPPKGDLPGMFDYRLFLAGRAIKWQGKILDEQEIHRCDFVCNLYRKILQPCRQSIISQLKELLPPNEASLAAAVLLGAKDQSSRAASSPFSDLGLAHLFAVSGLHVGVLLGLFLLPGKLMGISASQKWFLLFLILPPYALLTGLPGSVVRAAGLALLATASRPLGRRGHPLHYLGILFWATTIWNPWQVLDTGVRLSYTAAGGILAFTSLTKGINFPRKGWRGFILGGLFISMAAQWATLPLAAASFGRISLVSPLANLIAVPTFGMGVWLVVLSLAGSAVPGGVGGIFGAWAWLVFRSLAGMVKLANNQTGGWNLGMTDPGPFKIIIWMVSTGLCLLWLHKLQTGNARGKPTVVSISLTGVLLLLIFTTDMTASLEKPGPEIWQFDVGQGDCSLVRFPDGWKAMIDTGGRFGFSGKDSAGPLSRTIVPWLRRLGISDCDAVLLTHGHLDHTGGASFLLRKTHVGKWYGAGKALASMNSDTIGVFMEKPIDGQILHQWKNWSLKVYFPLATMPDHLHENDQSLVVGLLLKDKIQYLWSGDLEKDGEALMMKNGSTMGNARIWKAGHHGSNTSGSQVFLNSIKPQLILISCGTGNSYHHPSHGYYVVSKDTIDVVRTDLEGSIHLKFQENGELSWESGIRQGQLPAVP